MPSDHNVDGTSYPPSTPYSSRPSSFSALRTTILSGSELDSLSEQQFQALVKQVTVFYRTTPKHKMSIIRALQAGGDVVAMTGDGGE